MSRRASPLRRFRNELRLRELMNMLERMAPRSSLSHDHGALLMRLRFVVANTEHDTPSALSLGVRPPVSFGGVSVFDRSTSSDGSKLATMLLTNLR